MNIVIEKSSNNNCFDISTLKNNSIDKKIILEQLEYYYH